MADRSYGIGRGLASIRALGADPRFIWWWLHSQHSHLDAVSMGTTYRAVTTEDVGNLAFPTKDLDEQRRIAEFLDSETSQIDELVSAQRRIIELADERVASQILAAVGRSQLAEPDGQDVAQIKRLLVRLNRPILDDDTIITAYRDGQVTARSARRQEGYTEAVSSDPQGQGVAFGDVVIHGLDGFAGAIGDSEAAGNCSPVYHVCKPADGGNAAFYGRLLRLLALDGYLSLFATSTRERAVDFRNWERFGRVWIPKIRPEIQHDIGRRIVQMRPIREEVRRFIERLAERRQVLIIAAVTGQIDVTTARGVA